MDPTHLHHQGPPSSGVRKEKGWPQGATLSRVISEAQLFTYLLGGLSVKRGYPLQDGDSSEWEAYPSPCGEAVRRPEVEKGTLSFPCSEPAEIELLILP